eukprot:4195047-Pyramimonas_sp.AAC.1
MLAPVVSDGSTPRDSEKRPARVVQILTDPVWRRRPSDAKFRILLVRASFVKGVENAPTLVYEALCAEPSVG